MSALPSLKDLEVKKPHQWTKHFGGKCPVLDDAKVMVRYRNGKVAGPYPAKTMRWRKWPDGHDCSFDLVAFKIEG